MWIARIADAVAVDILAGIVEVGADVAGVAAAVAIVVALVRVADHRAVVGGVGKPVSVAVAIRIGNLLRSGTAAGTVTVVVSFGEGAVVETTTGN
jgi:hypothetical protein